MKKQKLEVIVITGHELTKEERKNYKRDHPGYRLAFWLRYPDFPLYLGGAAVVLSVIALLLKLQVI